MENIFLGIDVGTGSVRVGALDRTGSLLGKGEQAIQIWRPQTDFVEQSSEDIWEATGKAIRACLEDGQIEPQWIKGISFDATCSLVALKDEFEPISISPTGKQHQNIIVWMDHRATLQAQAINRRGHEVLQYVGGEISPEMEPPKLMWIKENLKDTWRSCKKFMDLADYMVYRSTNNDRRSICTTVCKWTYLGHEGNGGAYRIDFFEANGIEDLFEDKRVPLSAYPMGDPAGQLTEAAARELGLLPGIAVGVGIIDAHAGGLGSLGPVLAEPELGEQPFDHAIALIGGTSSCHMAVSPAPRFIDGVWGPYFGAMIPGMWLNEGGQSATGSLIDLVIQNNSAYHGLNKAAAAERIDIYSYLNRMIEEKKRKDGLDLFKYRHVLPYYHGNRSPRADPHAKGMISGLSLSSDLEEVALWYGATLQAIAYGTRHILEAMNAKGYSIKQIYLCGGHLKNKVFIQEHADITGCEVLIPEEPEAVLLGSAILGAVAAGEFPDIPSAMSTMCRTAHIIRPDPKTTEFHGARYEIFKEMYDFQKRIHAKMDAVRF